MIEYITQRLLQLPLAKPNNNSKEIAIIRCPYCGDSTHSNKPHLHIGLKENNTLVMDCKKCFVQGSVTPDLFHRLGIYDPAIDEYVKKVNINTYSKTSHNLIDENIYKNSLIYPKEMNSTEKIDYITKRTNLDLTDENVIKQYKIVLDLKEFYKINNIENPFKDDYKLDMLSKDAIGFVSYDNKSITIRNITKNNGKNRYIISHFYQNDRSPYIYIPPCNVDLLSEKPIITMAEGAFDIICIKNYFYSNQDTNIIFGATGSKKAYTRTLSKLLYLTGFFDGTIIIYADNDEEFSLEEYKQMFKTLLTSFTIKIIVNQNGKDFGQMPIDGNEFDFKVYKI